MIDVPFVCLYDQLDRAFSSLQVENMKAVEHEDKELNDDFSVDPLADPRLDKLDLFNMSDGETRDAIMNASSSFALANEDDLVAASTTDQQSLPSSVESASDSGSGE